MSEIDLQRLRRHVARLTHAPRPAESEALEKARRYVSDQLREFGWSVEHHSFQVADAMGQVWKGVNLIAPSPNRSSDTRPRFCLGAHLDSQPDSPGADDNASAVAALLEIARCLDMSFGTDARLDLDLVVFDLEENGMLGGAEHVSHIQRQRVPLAAMISLEMLGYCNHAANSQSLPRHLVGKYPDTGNFIAVIGNQNSELLIERVRRGMQHVEGLPVETLAVSSNGEYLQATRLSDHSPFWDAGYPALMITDTSFLRNPHYHQPSDTIQTLDFHFLHQVTVGCLEAVRQILRQGL